MQKCELLTLMPKKLLLILIITLLPALAHAWTLPVKVTNTTAGINAGNKATVTIGAVSTDVTAGTKYFYPANTVTSVSVTIANIQNVQSITLDGAMLPLASPVTILKGTASTHSLTIVYSTAPTTPKRDVTLTQSPGGIIMLKVGGVAITTGGFTDVPVGTGVEITAQPSYGFKLVKITVNGNDDTTGAGSTSAVTKTFLVDGAFTPNSVTATFAVDPMITSATLSVPPNATAGTPVQAVTTASSNVSPIYYAYTTTCSGETQPASTNNIFNFTPAATGTCTVTVRVTAGTATPTLKTATVSVVSTIDAANYTCTACHATSTPYVVSLYNGSPHAPVTSCVDCHTNSPHSILATGAVCSPCHSSFPSYAPHTEFVGTDLCLGCHDPHSTVSSTAPAAHYNSVTTGAYPASYVTSRSTCADCHVRSATNGQIRYQWAASGHGNTTGLPWTAQDFKTIPGCVQCHTTTGFVAYSTGGVTAAWGVASDYTKEVLTCIGCHKDVTTGAIRTVPPLRPFADDSYRNRNVGTSNICMDCHSGTKNGSSIISKLNAIPPADFTNQAFVDPHHLAAGGTLHGKAGYHFSGRTYAFYTTNTHRTIGMGSNGTGTGGPCVACHKNEANGHTFEAGATPVCGNCHGTSLAADDLAADRQDYSNALGVLRAALAARGYGFYSSTTPRFTATNWGAGQIGADTMGAAFNYALLRSEPGAYAHNSGYAKRLLFDSIEYLHNETITGDIGTSLSTLVDAGAITQAAADSVLAYQAKNSCTRCHNPGSTGSHAAHLNDALFCAACHYATASTNTALVPGTAAHLNNQPDVVIGPANDPTGSATYSLATDTCASITCHAAGPQIWGSGPVSCESCHTGILSIINGITAPDMSLAFSRGHGQSGVGQQCLDCHDRSKRHLGGSGRLKDTLGGVLNTECNFCHNNAGVIENARFRNMSTHFTKGGGQAECADCHDPHGTTNLSMIRTSIIGQTITYTDRSTGLVNTATNLGLCQVCHTDTAHYRAGEAETKHTATNCFGCHNHNSAGGAFQPKGTCDACHGYPPIRKVASAGTFGTMNNWSSARFEDYSGGGGAHLVAAHISPTARASEGWDHCALCHTGGALTSESHQMQIPVSDYIGNITIGVDNRYRFSDRFITYTGAHLLAPPAKNATGACFNVSCHMSPSPRWEDAGEAPMTCASCHRMPPLDAADGLRDQATGAVKGNHQGHSGSSAESCVKCHGAGPATYTTAHGDRAIQFAGNIDNSPKSGGASYSRAFANQTSVPPAILGTCSNVNCHFEQTTEAWGSESFSSPTDCVACHGLAPATGSHPVTGSRHGAYYGTGTGSCIKCHPDHLAEAKPFAHATSAAKRGIVVQFAAAPNNGGVYSGPVDDYLPSQTNVFGACTNIYCHSDGAGGAPNVVPAWGGSLDCGGCHGNPPAYDNGTPKPNSHAKHNLGCSSCHAGTTSDGATIADPSRHANGSYEVTPGAGITFTYAFAAGGGTCSAISCHGNGTATWGVPLGCDGCHDAPPRTASHFKHFSSTVAQAAYGDTRIAQDFGASSTAYVFGCGNCHPQDLAKHGNGSIEVELHNATAPVGSPKRLSPATASYVKGAPLTDSRGYAYSKGTCSNVYCHSYRSWTTPTGVPSSTACNPAVPANMVTTTNYKTVTWGGASLGCAGCHANPPQTSYPANGGGAGDSHAWLSDPFGFDVGAYGPVQFLHTNNMWYETGDSSPISCTYCHNDTVREQNAYRRIYTTSASYVNMSSVPIANFSKHVNGTNDVAFERQATVPAISYYYSGNTWTGQKLTNASYEPATKTCSNVACHLTRTKVKWGTPYQGGAGNDCLRCHEDYYGGGVCPDAATADSHQPTIFSAPPPLASPGYQYRYTVDATQLVAGTPTSAGLTYSLGTHPEGMTISSAGIVTWTPSALGSADVTVLVSSGGLPTSQYFTISVVNPQVFITSTPTTTATAWNSYVNSSGIAPTIRAETPSGMPAVTYTLTTSPPGMGINGTTGVITWTPTNSQVGNVPVTATATSGGYSSSQSFTIVVAPSPISFTSSPGTPQLTLPATYTYTAVATKSGGGTISYSLYTRPATVPAMTINATTGALAWTAPALPAHAMVTIVATSTDGYKQRQTFTVVTQLATPKFAFTSSPVTTAKVGVPYTYTVTGTKYAAGTLSYAVTGTGVTINPTTGVVTCTPTNTTKKSVVVTAKIAGVNVATQSFDIEVNP